MLGGLDEVPRLVRRWAIRTIVVGVRKPNDEAVRRLTVFCEEHGLDLLQFQLEFQSVTPRGSPITYPNPMVGRVSGAHHRISGSHERVN